MNEEEEESKTAPVHQKSTPEVKSLPVIDQKLLIKPGWIQIPVRPAIRQQKQQQSYNYYNGSSHNQQKFENKVAIPRLFWFHKSQSLFDVYKQIIKQYSFAQDDDPESHNPDVFFLDNYDQIVKNLDQNDMLDSAELHQDSTSLPLTVNISNPNYDPHKYSYYVPECKNCGQKTCKNCQMPVTNSKNLGDLLELIVM